MDRYSNYRKTLQKIYRETDTCSDELMKYKVNNSKMEALAIAVIMVILSTTTMGALSLVPSNVFAASDKQEETDTQVEESDNEGNDEENADTESESDTDETQTEADSDTETEVNEEQEQEEVVENDEDTEKQNVEASNDNNDKEDKLVFNHHSHTKIDEKHGITGNEGSVLNEEDSHINSNDNTNREDRIKCNSHSIPANTGGEGNVPC
jgi:hypothetical protein